MICRPLSIGPSGAIAVCGAMPHTQLISSNFTRGPGVIQASNRWCTLRSRRSDSVPIFRYATVHQISDMFLSCRLLCGGAQGQKEGHHARQNLQRFTKAIWGCERVWRRQKAHFFAHCCPAGYFAVAHKVKRKDMTPGEIFNAALMPISDALVADNAGCVL